MQTRINPKNNLIQDEKYQIHYIFTAPALGYGAIVAGVYFVSKEKEPGKFKLPDIVGAGAGYTQNGSFNNVLSPTKGLRVHLEYTEFLEFRFTL